MSSITPTMMRTVAAPKMPSGSDDSRKSSRKSGSIHATPSATTNAAYIATPPMRGVGSLCTLRSSGISTAPTRDARARRKGVTRNDTAAAAPKTMRKGRTRPVRDADPRCRECTAQLCDLVFDARAQLLVVGRRDDLVDPFGDPDHLRDTHPARRYRWGSKADARRVAGFPRIERRGVVVQLDASA